VSATNPSPINQPSDSIEIDIKPIITAVPTTIASPDKSIPSPVADVKPSTSSNDRSVLQTMNELAKFNKVDIQKIE
jgi:hypothetical protein